MLWKDDYFYLAVPVDKQINGEKKKKIQCSIDPGDCIFEIYNKVVMKKINYQNFTLPQQVKISFLFFLSIFLEKNIQKSYINVV